MALRICLPAVAPVKTPSHMNAKVETIGMAINQGVKSDKRLTTTSSEVMSWYNGCAQQANINVKIQPTPNDQMNNSLTSEVRDERSEDRV